MGGIPKKAGPSSSQRPSLFPSTECYAWRVSNSLCVGVLLGIDHRDARDSCVVTFTRNIWPTDEIHDILNLCICTFVQFFTFLHEFLEVICAKKKVTTTKEDEFCQRRTLAYVLSLLCAMYLSSMSLLSVTGPAYL